MHRYAAEVKKLLSDKQEESRERNEAIDQHLYDAASDPRHPLKAPPRQEVPPFLNFAPLDNALSSLDRSAQRYAKAIHAFASKANGSNATHLSGLNTRLIQTERHLISPEGLPRRPWFKNLIYAPGFYTGYGAKSLPGVREGIEENRYEEADREIARVAHALNDYAASVNGIAEELEKK